MTPADLIADYYGGSSLLRCLIVLTGVLYVIPYIVMQIKAGGYLAQRMFPDTETITLFGGNLVFHIRSWRNGAVDNDNA